MSLEIVDNIKNRIKSRNIDSFEIFLTEDKFYETIFLKDQIENLREGKDFEYTIRILDQKDEKTGIGVTKGNLLSGSSLDKSIDFASSIAKQNSGLNYQFPFPSSLKSISTVDENILKDPYEIQKSLSEDLLSVVNEHKKVTPTFGRFRIHITSSFLSNSNEINLESKKTHFFVEFALKGQKNGRLTEYWPVLYLKDKNQLQFEKRVNQWAKLTYDALKSKAPNPSNKATIIFSPQLVENLLNPILSFHTSGKTLHEKMSMYSKDGKIASDIVNIKDNGLMPGGLRTNSFDGEGNPHQITVLVKEGIFKNRIYDHRHAILEGIKSTGNGLRAVNGAIANTISNIEISPGDMTLEDMISNIKVGYFIDSCAWMNPSFLTGEFGSLIRNGYYIENGKIQYPIQDGNVSGNVHKMLKRCIYISKERDYAKNSLVPHMAFDNLTISY